MRDSAIAIEGRQIKKQINQDMHIFHPVRSRRWGLSKPQRTKVIRWWVSIRPSSHPFPEPTDFEFVTPTVAKSKPDLIMRKWDVHAGDKMPFLFIQKPHKMLTNATHA
jgi:hypothetical protein